MSQAPVTEVDASVVAVIVYEPVGAQVRRATNVNIEEGDNTLIFSNIPADIDQQTLQVSLTERKQSVAGNELDGGVVPEHCILRGISFETIEMTSEEATEKLEVEAAEARRKLDALFEEIELKEMKQKVCQNRNKLERDLMTRMLDIRTRDGDSTAPIDSDFWKRNIEERCEHERSFRSQDAEMERELKELYKQRDALQAKLGQNPFKIKVGGRLCPTPKRRHVVKVLLSATRPYEQLRVSVSYAIKSATWRAIYNLYLDRDEGTALLQYDAMVSQWSSENWDDVTLTFSTAKPSAGGRAPELQPWHIDFTPGVEVLNNEPQMEMQKQVQQMVCMVQTSENELQPQGEGLVTTSRAAASLSYTVTKPYTIPRTRAHVRVKLTEIPLEAIYTHVAVPKLNDAAYTVLRADNPTPYVFLSGDVAIYNGNQYTSKTLLPLTAPRARLAVSVGVDDAISVKYKRLQTQTDARKAMLGSGSFVTKRFVRQMELVSHHREPVTITLRDQIPVPEDDCITVELIDPQISVGDVRRSPEGFILYPDVNLNPEETVKLRLVFTVQYPTGRRIVGLN